MCNGILTFTNMEFGNIRIVEKRRRTVVRGVRYLQMFRRNESELCNAGVGRR